MFDRWILHLTVCIKPVQTIISRLIRDPIFTVHRWGGIQSHIFIQCANHAARCLPTRHEFERRRISGITNSLSASKCFGLRPRQDSCMIGFNRRKRNPCCGKRYPWKKCAHSRQHICLKCRTSGPSDARNLNGLCRNSPRTSTYCQFCLMRRWIESLDIEIRGSFRHAFDYGYPINLTWGEGRPGGLGLVGGPTLFRQRAHKAQHDERLTPSATVVYHA